MNQKNKIIFLSSLIIGVLTLTLGVTFAIFNFNKTSTNSKLIVGDIYMHYNETNQISLENAMPLDINDYLTYQVNSNMTEEELNKCVNYLTENGMPLTDGTTMKQFCQGTGTSINGYTFQQNLDNNDWFPLEDLNYLEENNIVTSTTHTIPYFEFTVDGKNTTTNKDIWYEIVLSHGDNHPTRTTRIRDDLLKFRLVETKDGVETTVIDNKSYSDLNNHRIWVDTINKNTTTEVIHTYRLYMWIYNDTIIGNVNQDYTMEEWNDVYASIKVNVTGDFNEKELAYEDIATDASCFTTTTNEDNTITITDYDASCGTDIVIPKTINGNTVTTIGESAFDYNQLTSVTIPNSVTTIGSYAFYHNQLTSVTIPNTVTTIGESAFRSNQLTSVTIPNSVTTIGGSAFNDNLLPDDQAFIYERTDNNSDGIAEIDNTIIISYGGANKQPIIPDSVTTIGTGAFRSNQLTSVVIPDSVTIIGTDAFRSNQLTSVVISDSVTTIGSYAFSSNKLTSVTIPNSVTYLSCFAFDDTVTITKNEDLTCTSDGDK